MSEKEEKVSLRDSLEKALESDETADDTVEEPEKAADEPVEELAAEPEKTEPVEEPVEEPEKVEEPEQTDAPAHWALEHQELFRKSEPAVQKFLLDRSKDMEAAHTKRSQEIAPLRTVVQKWQPYIDKLGATPEQAVEALFAAEYTLRTGTEAQKRGVLHKLAQDYGIPLEATAKQEPADFMTDGIRQAVQPLEETVGRLQSQLSQRDQESHLVQQAQKTEEIRLFREAKTEAGKPAHPYFDEVEANMMTLAQAELASGRVPELKTLYETAVWANPTVREKLLAAQQHAAKQQSERERKEKVEKAKNASVSVSGSSAAPKDQPKSLRDNLEEQFARV